MYLEKKKKKDMNLDYFKVEGGGWLGVFKFLVFSFFFYLG